MAKTAWQAYIEGADGLPVASPTIEVRIESSGALATIYSSAAGAALANPFTGGTDGLARFYASAGVYKITATSGAYTSTFRYVSIGEAAGYDIGASTGKVMTYDQAIEACGLILTADDTITVGTGGDFTLLSSALEYASRIQPQYAKQGNILTINLLSGYQLDEQIMIEGGNYNFVKITSVDPVVTIVRSAITTSFSTEGFRPALFFSGCVAPAIYCSFEMDTSGTATNRVVLLYNFAKGYIDNSGYSIKGGVLANVVANAMADVYMDGVDVSGASASYGVYCQKMSRVFARSVDASSSGTYGFYVDFSGEIHAESATGTLSQTANTRTVNGLIIQ